MNSEPAHSGKSSENYYDILIKSTKKNKPIIPPRRINSLTNINELNKRPSDYYIRKLSASSLNLAKRPISGDSIVSLNSTYSDEISLNSAGFDPHDSRLSSMTSKSILSPSDSPNLNIFPEKLEEEIDSLATITTTNVSQDEINDVAERSFGNKLSNTSVQSIDSSINNSQSFSSSTLTLSRTKTKYLSQEEIKSRQKLRKKQYDESYFEDEILSNDIDLVFNVPVIKNQSELYFKKSIRNNLLDDNQYKPFPLPGKLRSNSTPNLKPINTTNTPSKSNISVHQVPEKVIEEETTEDPEEESFDSFSVDDDSQIISNISNYYSQRSKSYSKLVQMSRHDNMLYKLPNYIKSQSSMEDLNLISPEKINFVDQTRPINLPPKPQNDKAKHNRELKRMIKDFEKSSFFDEGSCDKEWTDLINDASFDKRLVNEKNIIRKLNWDSNCPETLRYDYMVKLLSVNHHDDIQKIDDNFEKLYSAYMNLNESIKINRNIEFQKIIESVLTKPLFHSNLCLGSSLMVSDIDGFKENFSTILFIKSIDNSLQKHDEIFLIPVIGLLFGERSVKEQFRIIELMNQRIFTKELRTEINKGFETWSSKLPKKISGFLQNFNLQQEFSNLNLSQFFDILLQLNDKLPLSISASLPSTPISSNAPSIFQSCSKEVVFKFLQLLSIYNVNYKTKLINHNKIFQSMLTVIIKYYHINWNDFTELIRHNKSIKLNFNMNNGINLNNFNDKWKTIFRSI